jgi:two-component system, NarL family, sensor kinase
MGIGNLPRGEFATHAYRIVQELATNALKHAGANHILVQLSQVNGELVIVIEDDGIGFDLKKSTEGGCGLKNIHSRVNYLKGTIEWYSGVNHGVSVLIHLPIPLKEPLVGQFVPPAELQYYG